MKKATIILGGVILLSFAAFCCIYFIVTAPKYMGNFSASELLETVEIQNFQNDSQHGSIGDYKSAAKAGKIAIRERFENGSGHIFKWMGCEVCFDEQRGAYLVHTYPISLLPGSGGAYNVILEADGTILAIWGEK